MTAVLDQVLSAERRKAYGEALDLLATKLAEDEHMIGLGFPYVTAPDGSWRTMPASRSAGYTGGAWSHGNWFCGRPPSRRPSLDAQRAAPRLGEGAHAAGGTARR